LILLLVTGCGMTGSDGETGPPPVTADGDAQDGRAQPPPGDEAWLQTLREDLARIGKGQPPPRPKPPPVTVAGTPGAVGTPDEPSAPTQPQTPVEPPAPAVTPPAPQQEQQPPQQQPATVEPPPVAPPRPAPGAQPVISGQDLESILRQSREHAVLVDQRTSTLVSAFVQEGLAALDRGDLAAAHGHFANAYELDPADPAARDLYHRTRMVMGGEGAGLATVVSDAADTMRAGADQTRTLVAHHRAQGDRALAAGDAEAALQHYEDAMTLLRSSPAAPTGSGDEAGLAQRLAVARRAAQDAAAQRDSRLTERAIDLQEQYDAAEAERGRRRIEQLMDNANAAFVAEDYDGAEAALEEILKADPGNADAANLKRIASRARHDRRDEATRKTYRRAWQDTFDELQHDMVPQTDLIVFPDSDRWDVIANRGTKDLGGAAGSTRPEDQAVLERLEKRIPVAFQDEPLDQVLAHLSTVTGVNFLMSQAVRDLGPGEGYDYHDKANVPVSRILKVVLEDLSMPPLTYTVRDGVVHVITQDEARSDYTLQMYDIRDLTFTPADYPAEDFNLLPSGIDADSYRGGVEDDEPLPFIGADSLLTLIQDNIATESWSSDPNRTIQLMPGTLVVRQTPEVHRQIKELLDDLRVNTKTLIHIETRFIEVEDSFLEDIGVDLRGLEGDLTGFFPLEDFGQSGAGGFGLPDNPQGIGTGNEPGFYYGGDNGDLKGRTENLFDLTLGEPGTLNSAGGLSLQALFLDDTNVNLVLRAVSKYQTSNIVNAPSLTLRSGQRGNVKGMTTRTYVRDFEPEIAQAAVIAQPELDNVKDGVLLDVRAVASADRRFITLELRPTVIDLVPDEFGFDLPQQTVSLGTQNSSDVTIELPELRIQRLRTTATVPDGGTLLLGGLKRSVEQNLTSGVPFLSDIPILGALFSRKGEYTSKRKLIILLKATIVAPEEHEPRRGFKR
jgi:general secretion pathway protein D